MNTPLGREVATMLNIEAGAPVYAFSEEIGAVVRPDSPTSRIYVGGFDSRLRVDGPGHPRGFRFHLRADATPENRFDWSAIHRRVEKLLAERSR